MQRHFFISIIFSLFIFSLNAQITRVRGVITDAETNEPLPFVSVYFQNTQVGTITNTDGEYFI
ncbi:MAG: carboxypeptidase-like regulatory domain-containing protein, partial [Bacteroidales bacterium]